MVSYEKQPSFMAHVNSTKGKRTSSEVERLQVERLGPLGSAVLVESRA